jgi:hypothetical protein
MLAATTSRVFSAIWKLRKLIKLLTMLWFICFWLKFHSYFLLFFLTSVHTFPTHLSPLLISLFVLSFSFPSLPLSLYLSSVLSPIAYLVCLSLSLSMSSALSLSLNSRRNFKRFWHSLEKGTELLTYKRVNETKQNVANFFSVLCKLQKSFDNRLRNKRNCPTCNQIVFLQCLNWSVQWRLNISYK